MNNPNIFHHEAEIRMDLFIYSFCEHLNDEGYKLIENPRVMEKKCSAEQATEPATLDKSFYSL